MHIYSFKTKQQCIPIAYRIDIEGRAFLVVWDKNVSYPQCLYAIEMLISTIVSLLGNNWVSQEIIYKQILQTLWKCTNTCKY